jgi:hypothetical protein
LAEPIAHSQYRVQKAFAADLIVGEAAQQGTTNFGKFSSSAAVRPLLELLV